MARGGWGTTCCKVALHPTYRWRPLHTAIFQQPRLWFDCCAVSSAETCIGHYVWRSYAMIQLVCQVPHLSCIYAAGCGGMVGVHLGEKCILTHLTHFSPPIACWKNANSPFEFRTGAERSFFNAAFPIVLSTCEMIILNIWHCQILRRWDLAGL